MTDEHDFCCGAGEQFVQRACEALTNLPYPPWWQRGRNGVIELLLPAVREYGAAEYARGRDDAGRCGEQAPKIGWGPGQVCALTAGHAGWHRSDENTEWGRLSDPNEDEADCDHHSWAGLMALLDEHWPEDIFPTREDDITRDAGARIVSLIRWVDRLRGTSS